VAHHLNRKQAETFARAHGLPLVLWKQPLTGRAAELLDAGTIQELYDNEPGLWGAFVRGAPAMLTENIQPTKLLANGACGYMHSLSFLDDEPPEWADAAAAPGYSLVLLDDPPLAVNFQLTLPDGDDGEGIDSLVDNAVVVPIVQSKHVDTYDTTSLWACLKGVPKTLRFRPHPVTIAFAVTDFKLQGKTKDELLLSIAPRPFPPHLERKAFYVMVSRVRTRRRLRVLHKPAKAKGGFGNILQMKHTPELAAWNDAYDENGDWEPERAQQRAAPKVKAPPSERRRASARAGAAAGD